MTALVFDVTAAAAASGARFHVTGSMSAKIGTAPVCTTTLAVAQNVSGVVMTSWPAPTSAPSSARCSAAVHELTATAYGAPTKRAKATSNAWTRGPVDSHP